MCKPVFAFTFTNSKNIKVDMATRCSSNKKIITYCMKRLLLLTLGICSMLFATAQGTETFTNATATGSTYSSITWQGDNAQTWTATDTRTDQPINGKAALIRNGAVKCNTIQNGIGTLQFKYKIIYSGAAVLEVYINNVLKGTFTPTATEQTATINNINAGGVVALEIRQTTSGARPGIDDITWTAYNERPVQRLHQRRVHRHLLPPVLQPVL